MAGLMIQGIAGGPRRVRPSRGVAPAALAVVVGGVLGLAGGRGGRIFQEMWSAGDRHLNERTAIATLVEIAAAEEQFRQRNPELRYGSLADIVSAGLVGADLADGRRSGYVFAVAASYATSEFLWAATANPESSGRCYAINQAGVIFYTDDGPVSVDAEWCSLPLGAPWYWPDHDCMGGKCHTWPDRVRTTPVEVGVWDER